MAHLALVDGTTYEISGGKTLIGGTGYSIDKGKTLVDGTAYEVGFGGFKVIFDFGILTPSSTDLSVGVSSEHPSGYDACTHLIVDGVAYEVTISQGMWGPVYTPVGDCVVKRIDTNPYYNSILVAFNTAGTYTVQLGIQS